MNSINGTWHPSYAHKIKAYYARYCEYTGKDENGKFTNQQYYLHRMILNLSESSRHIMVDHQNHNTLDNRRKNLRITVNNKNSKNRNGANINNKSGYRNVHLITGYNNKQHYKVQIMKDGERYIWDFELNQFEEACKFAEIKRLELFGKFAGKG